MKKTTSKIGDIYEGAKSGIYSGAKNTNRFPRDKERRALKLILKEQLDNYKSDIDNSEGKKPSTINTALSNDVITSFEVKNGLDLSKDLSHKEKILSPKQIAILFRQLNGEDVDVEAETSSGDLTSKDVNSLTNLALFSNTEHNEIAGNEDLISKFDPKEHELPEDLDDFITPEDRIETPNLLLIGTLEEQVQNAGLNSVDHKKMEGLLSLIKEVNFPEKSLSHLANSIVTNLLKDITQDTNLAVVNFENIKKNLILIIYSKLSPENAESLMVSCLKDMGYLKSDEN